MILLEPAVRIRAMLRYAYRSGEPGSWFLAPKARAIVGNAEPFGVDVPRAGEPGV
jgi:hypothetical protein